MKLRPFLYAIAGLSWVAVPLVASAAGLVPCVGAADCNICTFGQLIQNIINFVIGLSIPISAVLFSYAGWLYFSNREDTSKIEKAHRIFTSVFIGFCIAIAGWLIVQTVLKTLAPGYQSWTTFTCTADRPMNTTIGQLFQQSGVPNVNSTPIPPLSAGGSAYVCQSGTLTNGGCVDTSGNVVGQPVLQSSADNNGLGCPDGSALAGGHCYTVEGIDLGEAAPLSPDQLGRGDCSPNTLAGDFEADANTMSCIGQRESGCSTIGTGDRTADGNYASIGTYQINMSNHVVQCDEYDNGQPLDCSKAYNVAVTGTTMRNGTARVVNSALYSECKTRLMNPSCNSQVAQGVLNTEGFKAWSTYKTYCGGV